MAKRKKLFTRSRQQKLGQLLAGIGASFMPIASYTIVHFEADATPAKWALVASALLFSAPMVIDWAKRWCGHWVKAVGFTALLEGVMVFSSIGWLGMAGLVVLVGINAQAAWINAARFKDKPI